MYLMINTIIDINVTVQRNEEAASIIKSTRNVLYWCVIHFVPYSNCIHAFRSSIDSIIDADENTMRILANQRSVCESDSASIPRCIRA